MKVSDINVKDIADYLRLSMISDEDDKLLKNCLNIAKNYISSYTGLPITSTDKNTESLDSYPEFIIVIYILCQDMYDNRCLYVESKSINKTVQTILDMHTRDNIC